MEGIIEALVTVDEERVTELAETLVRPQSLVPTVPFIQTSRFSLSYSASHAPVNTPSQTGLLDGQYSAHIRSRH